jgi:hypothetical protein
MIDMDELLRGLQDIDPLWSVALVALALLVLIAAKLWHASFGKALAAGATLAVVGAVFATAFYFYQHLNEIHRLEERRGFEERAVTIFAQTMQPGTVFACLDGSPMPAMMEACERVLFMEPQRAAAAVAITTQRLAFLADAVQFANKRDPSYHTRIESLRDSVENDAFGIVAYVMSLDHRCTADSCERFSLLRDASRVRENLRSRRFEAFMAKHGPVWREAAPAAPVVRESPLPPSTARPSISSGVTIGDRAGASEIGDPSTATRAAAPALPPALAAPAPQPQVSIPGSATAPEVTPPNEAKSETAPAAAIATAEPAPAAKSLQPAKAAPAATAKSPQPPAAQKAAAKAKAAATDPATKRTNEPVAGLPRVVPRDYIRDKEEQETAPTQAAGQQPGAPIEISPQQN